MYFVEQADVTVTKNFKVLRKSSSVLSYVNRTQNKEMHYFSVVAAEGQNIVGLRIYLRTKFNMVKEGMRFKFINIIAKAENEFWVTSHSSIAYSSIVEADPDLEVQIPLLPENMPPEGEQKSLAVALRSPEKSTISAKVVMVCNVLKYASI